MSATLTNNSLKQEEFPLGEASQDPRCRHKTPSGRRCERQPAVGNYGFCASHAGEGHRFRIAEATAIARELLGADADFGDPAVVNQMLGKLFTLVAQGRIPVSTAALLAQIGQLLVQGLQGSHGDVRLAEVNNAWRQTIVNVLNSADRNSHTSDVASVHYEDLGRRIAESEQESSEIGGQTERSHDEGK